MNNTFIKETKALFKASDVVVQLIAVNVAVFAVYHLIHLFFFLFAADDHFLLMTWLAAPADLSALALRPWTVISYMFFHQDLLHLLFNMLWLFWFGKIFRVYFDKNLLFNVFILGGLAGVFFYIASYNLFPVFSAEKYFSTIIGGSASVLAVVLGVSCYAPHYKINLFFFGSIQLIYIAAAVVLLDLVSISMSDNTGGHIAHLGGAFFGYLFAINIQKRKDITAWFTRWYLGIQSLFRKKPKMKVHYKKPPANDWDYNKQKKDNQAEIDHILDKISKGGYDALTREEKEILFRQKNN
ncbi:MAG: rhomboid family intramembrane serine protease [Bacteroidales bacterium]|jgi:membrane associated rhomboid family serine protease|nr:rhomboid family intramembrane serine protease [Bacteroidales bacterium]